MTDLVETPQEVAELEAVRTEQPAPAAPPAPETPPAVAPAAPAAPAAPEKPSRMVPHAALHEERVRRQALERELAEVRKAKPPETPAAAEDDPDETIDPIGALAALKRKIAGNEQRDKEQRERFNAEQELAHRVGTRVTAYAQEHPEYTEQVAHLRKSRADELSLLGYDAQQVAHQIMVEEMNLARMAIDKDMDPGEMIANLAKHRGWKAKDPDPPPAPAVPAAPAPAPEAERQIERLARGQRAARSSSNGGGSGPEPEITLETLANLDGAAFDKAWSANAKRLMQ